MRKLLVITLAFTLAIGIVTPQAFCAEVVIKAVTAFPKNHLNNDPVQMFIDKVNEARGRKGKNRLGWRPRSYQNIRPGAGIEDGHD